MAVEYGCIHFRKYGALLKMKTNRISKVEMARRMGTSRSQLDRFLDPQNDKVLLETVQRAAPL